MIKFNKAFWKWFEDSKVVDGKGLPLVVYHGTAGCRTMHGGKPFTTFNVEGNLGAHFGTAKQASYRAGKTENYNRVYPCYLSIKNPLRMRDVKYFEGIHLRRELARLKIKTKFIFSQDIKEDLIAAGYDGIVYLNRYEGLSKEAGFAIARDPETGDWAKRCSDKEFLKVVPEARDSWVAFFPEQIKSINNSGSWSWETRNIMNPISSSELLDTAYFPYRVEGVYFDFQDYGPNIVEIANFEATPQGKGLGVKALKILFREADKLGITLMLIPAGNPDNGDHERLVAFYERMGFQFSGETMWRVPKPR